MPPTSTPYRLVGFAAELDWRPLHFVRPIPRNRICSACGLVRTSNALLPCMHVLCESCCDQCGEGGIRVCLLDGEKCPDDDIDWKEYATEDLLKREFRLIVVVLSSRGLERHVDVDGWMGGRTDGYS
ncbi:uncharacterized protein LOC144103878 isoform X2 [Amblyomma americanum]